jgi:hypothetical protein
MTESTDPIPYAKPEPTHGWFRRHSAGAATRMIAFAFMALVAVAWRALMSSVIGNADLPDAKYVLIGSCVGFAFEYVVWLVGT